MNSITLANTRRALDENPGGYLYMIVQNNPNAVADRLHKIYQRPTTEGDIDGIVHEIADLINQTPDHAADILRNVLSVPVITAENIGFDPVAKPLTTVGQEIYLDKTIAYQQKLR